MFRLMKIFTILTVLFMTFSLIGCSSTSVISKSESSAASEVEKQTDNSKVEVEEAEVQESATEHTLEHKDEVSTTHQTVEKTDEIKEEISATETEKNKSTTKVSEKKSVTSTSTSTSTNEKPKTASNTTTKPTTETKKQTITQNTVSITIKGPKDFGSILPKTAISFKEGDTVLDVLRDAGEKNHFQVEYSGTGAMAYIEGIDNIYEFDYGPTSGWNFKLNGKEVSKSSDSVKVQKDDLIEWIYSEDFTEDK